MGVVSVEGVVLIDRARSIGMGAIELLLGLTV